MAMNRAVTTMTGNDYRDLIAAYIHHQYATLGLVVYREVNLGKTIIGKDRQIDVFVRAPRDQKAIAIECKYQDAQGTADEKIPYALEDLAALWMPGCLVYAGRGWSRGVLHPLEASRLAAPACRSEPRAPAHEGDARARLHPRRDVRLLGADPAGEQTLQTLTDRFMS